MKAVYFANTGRAKDTGEAQRMPRTMVAFWIVG